MKRIFCDCCGNEFEYDDALKPFDSAKTPVSLKGKAGTVAALMQIIFTNVQKTVGGEALPDTNLDLCKDCRIDIIKKFDTRPAEPQPEVFKPNKMSQAQVEAVFVKHGGGTADSYFLTKAKAMDVYRNIFKHVTGGDA